ncbi:MAG: hypothetical protein V2I46_01250 [Bacteroides sp.]|jgi:hypothetical protein|nr:hypothetical protein [Bacteroides sp.]
MENTVPKKAYKNINLVYGVFFFSMVIFLLIVSLLVSKTGPLIEEDPLMEQILKLIVIVFTVVIIPIAQGFPQRMIRKIGSDLSLAEKMARYQAALTVRFALTEGTGIMACLFFLITGDTDLMLLVAIILLYFIISRPSHFKMGADLELSEMEKKELFKE